MMIKPTKVMMSHTPATRVAAMRARLSTPSTPLTIQNASSVHGRLVKGSRTMRCASSFNLTTCSSVIPSDATLCSGLGVGSGWVGASPSSVTNVMRPA